MDAGVMYAEALIAHPVVVALCVVVGVVLMGAGVWVGVDRG